MSADVGTRAGEIAAAKDFIMTTNPVSSEAARLRDDFIMHWESLGWLDQNLPSMAVYDEIMNRNNQFWIANRPPEERATAVRIVKENRSDPRQTTSGLFPNDKRLDNIERPDIEVLEEQIEDAKPLFEIPVWFKTGVIVAVLGGAALGIAKIVTGLNPMALAAKFAAKKGV
jgi:hypothetical protein